MPQDTLPLLGLNKKYIILAFDEKRKALPLAKHYSNHCYNCHHMYKTSNTEYIFILIYALSNSYNRRKYNNYFHYILITNIQEGAKRRSYPLLMNYGARAGTKYQTSAIFTPPGGTQTPFNIIYSLISWNSTL